MKIKEYYQFFSISSWYSNLQVATNYAKENIRKNHKKLANFILTNHGVTKKGARK